MSSAIEVASLFGTLELRDTATRTLETFNRQFDTTEGKLNRLAGGMQSIGLAISAATAPLVAFGASGIKVASDFEDAMAQISARTGIVGADLQMISDFALQMGADTAFSAQQAADAFLQLLSSGQSASEAMATLPAVLDAAAASGEDLGRTADTVTDIMAAFGLGVESAADVVNALAKAAGASSADMASLGQGFANVGPLAAQFGISVDEVAAILALFAENGIKGAEAGTQLKSMLTNMTGDTERVAGAWQRLGTSMFDAAGQARPIGEVLQDIRRGLAGMTEEQRIRTIQDLAGSFGQLGLTALTTNMSLEDMLALMDGSADAATVAAARMNTFSGRMDSLRGSIQTLQIKAMTPLMKAMTPLIEQATQVVNRVTEWVSANPALTSTLIQVVGVVAGLGGGLLTVGTALKLAIPAFGAIGTLIGALVSPLGLAVAGVGLLAAALGVDLGDALNKVIAVGKAFVDIFTNGLNVETAGNAIDALMRAGFSGETAAKITGFVGEVTTKLRELVDGAQVYLSLIPFYFEYYFSKAKTFFEQYIVAPIEGFGIAFGELLKPVQAWWNDTLLPELQRVSGWIDVQILEPLRDIWDDLQPLVNTVADYVHNMFEPVLNFINRALWSYEMLRRMGRGTPMVALPNEIAPGVPRPSDNPFFGTPGSVPPGLDESAQSIGEQVTDFITRMIVPSMSRNQSRLTSIIGKALEDGAEASKPFAQSTGKLLADMTIRKMADLGDQSHKGIADQFVPAFNTGSGIGSLIGGAIKALGDSAAGGARSMTDSLRGVGVGIGGIIGGVIDALGKSAAQGIIGGAAGVAKAAGSGSGGGSTVNPFTGEGLPPGWVPLPQASGMSASTYVPSMDTPTVPSRDPNWHESAAQRRIRMGEGAPFTLGQLHVHVNGVLDLTDPHQADEVATAVMEAVKRARR